MQDLQDIQDIQDIQDKLKIPSVRWPGPAQARPKPGDPLSRAGLCAAPG